MAAQTPTFVRQGVSAHERALFATLPALSNGDTWNTGFSTIDQVQLEPIGGTQGTDFCAVASISGGTITFAVSGTARTAFVLVYGRP